MRDFACIIAVLLCLPTRPLLAGTFTVTNLGDSGAGSLRNAIVSADAGDTIGFGVTGTIALTSGELVINKSLNIEGPGAPEALVIRRSTTAGTPEFRIFRLVGSSSTTVNLSGLTIANGIGRQFPPAPTPQESDPNQFGGGGILSEVALTLVNCIFDGNSGYFFGNRGGGAVLVTDLDSPLTVESCTFTGNLGRSGGAIQALLLRTAMTVSDSVFTSNRSTRLSGGAVDAVVTEGGSLQLFRCTFTGNTSESGGGAVSAADAFDNPGPVQITDCSFYGNSAQAGGGALALSYDSYAANLVRRCTFEENSAPSGGAIANAAPLGIENCTFFHNVAPPGSAGAISALRAVVVVRCCTFASNGALTIKQGRDSQNQPGSVQIGGAILDQGNESGPCLAGEAGSIGSLGFNLCSDAGAGALTEPTDRINTPAGLDPFGPQYHGGITKTIALLANSPAVDGGFSFNLATDQRGLSRPWDLLSYPATPGGDDSDIGAFESRDAVQSSPFVVNTLHDHDDGIAGAEDCTLREAIQRANAFGTSTVISFAPGLSGTLGLNRTLGPLTITGSPTLTGPGARILAISADSYMRVLTFTGSGVRFVSGLTLRDGFHGFGLLPGEMGFGAGILNEGTLTLEDCTLDHHYARGEQGPGIGGHGGPAFGGGIYNTGTLTLSRCTLRNCIAGGGQGTPNPNPFALGGSGGPALGGAVFNGGLLMVNNCTFFDNEAGGGRGGDAHFGGNGGHGYGAAVLNAGQMTITGTTITGNTGMGGFGGTGGNVFNNGSPGGGNGGITAYSIFVSNNKVRNTLCAGNHGNGNVPSDVLFDFTSEGYNLIGTADGSTGFNATGDQTGTDAAPLNAMLGPLQNNGGPTDTMMLLAGSPAIDRGNVFGLTVDQRGLMRTFDIPTIPNASGGDGTDIGAVEFTGFLFVTTLDDHDDGVASATDTTLREAISAAIAQPGTEVIGFLPGLTGTLQLASALPDLDSDMFIEGPGADRIVVRRNSGGNYRVFSVGNRATVTISGLTVANGNVGSGAFPGDSGGGILNDRSDLTLRACRITENNAVSGFTYGGGVFNREGVLVIESCTFSGNSAYYGGGLANDCARAGSANATVTGSTFADNSAGGGYGGAIFNSAVGEGAHAPMTLANCTLSGNSAAGGFGGAIYTSAANTGIGGLTVTHCTLSGNSASSGGGIYNFNFNGTAPVIVLNSIFNTGDSGVNLVNNGGTLSSQGYNLSNDSAGGDGTTSPGGLLNGTGDIRNTDPLLGALASNGGPTQTHLLLRNSPALDRGNSFGYLVDQRGLARIANAAHFPDAAPGDGADIGALEINPFGSLTDAESDGMPDEWEIFHGVDDPNGDPDNDGDSNLEEYGARTNPRDNGSFVLRIIAIDRSGNDVVITFNGVAGRTFRLERKDELTDPSWMIIPGTPDVTPPITGNTQMTHVGGFSFDHSFHRVRLLP